MIAQILNNSTIARRIMAIVALGGLLLVILLAGIARLAETPASGATGRFGQVGPGALGEIRFELAKIGTGKPDTDRATALRALGGQPLASDPFTALASLGLMDNPRGTKGAEAALLSEALRRDPRSRAARILLLRQMAATGDLDGAFEQLSVLYRLNPGLIEQIMEAITTRTGTVKQVDDALAALKGHDSLYLPFVNRMTGKKKPREVIERLAERLPPAIMNRPDIRRAVVRQLVDAGAFGQARTIWQAGTQGQPGGLVHAPDFADRSAAPPFNWQLFVGPTGAAEYAKNGSINLSYYDRTPGPLLAQLLTLAPGNYRASIDFEVLAGTADNVRLQIACRDKATPLAEASLIRRKAGPDRLILPFSIPAGGCAGQIVGILGVATEQRGQMQISVRRIDVTPGGRP